MIDVAIYKHGHSTRTAYMRSGVGHGLWEAEGTKHNGNCERDARAIDRWVAGPPRAGLSRHETLRESEQSTGRKQSKAN